MLYMLDLRRLVYRHIHLSSVPVVLPMWIYLAVLLFSFVHFLGGSIFCLFVIVVVVVVVVIVCVVCLFVCLYFVAVLGRGARKCNSMNNNKHKSKITYF